MSQQNQRSSKTHWKKYFNYEYLGSQDFEGSDIVATIKEVKNEIVKDSNGKEDQVMVVYFHEANAKKWIINKTNCKTIATIYDSNYVQDWVGQKIALFVADNIKAFGKITTGVRVRNGIPKPPDPEKVKLKELSRKVINALKSYKGDDKDDISAMLAEKNKSKEITIQLLENTLKNITNEAVVS